MCFESFSTANNLSIHCKVSHDTTQTASADDSPRRKTIDIVDDKSKSCDVQRDAVHHIAGSSPVDGHADERGDNTQQQGSSSSSSSSGGSQRDSDPARNASLPTFRSTGWCDGGGSLPPGDNVIEYPSMFPGLKHRLSIKNETVLVTRLDGVDTKAGCQMSLFKCHMCGRMFRLLSRLQCHLSMHFERQLLLFQCSLCDTQFQFKMQLLQHLRSHGVHNVNTDSPHTATTSSSQGLLSTVSPAFSSSSVNDVHPPVKSPSDVTEPPRDTSDLQTEDQTTPQDMCHDGGAGGLYACRYCWKTFDRYFCLQRHERVHTGFKPCCCRHCGKGFSESRNLRQHMMRFHNDVNPSQLIKRVRRKMSGSGLSRINQRLAYITPEMVANVQPTVSDVSGAGDALYPLPFSGPGEASEDWGGEPSSVSPPVTRPQHAGANHLASEIRKKESLGDDITVVIPSDVPLDDVTASQSRIDDRVLPWMMNDVDKESCVDAKQPTCSNDEIMSAPVKSILAYSQMKSSKRKLLPPARGPASPEDTHMSVDTKTVDGWTSASCGHSTVGLANPVGLTSPIGLTTPVGLPNPAIVSSGMMDYTGRPMSAFSASSNADAVPPVLPPRSDVLKQESTAPGLTIDSLSPSQFGLTFEDFDGDNDDMAEWLSKGHMRGTSFSRTHSR